MNSDFLGALKQIEKEKNIPADVLLRAIEDALVAAYKKNFGDNQFVIIEFDRSTGELGVWQRKKVVENVEDPDLEMSLEEAESLAPGVEVGVELDIEVPDRSFGRIAAQTAKQVMRQRIMDAEREILYGELVKREGEIITVTVQRYERVPNPDGPDSRNILVEIGKAEGVIPPEEQVKGEWFRTGERVKCYVKEVNPVSRGPQVVLSRSQPAFLKGLFELEVPEIRQNVVQVRAVVREAGYRSKIAVKSQDPKVDPVGACVGHKGSRVQAVVDELRGEKIDIIPWTEDTIMFVANSLQPARVSKVTLYDDDQSAIVVVPDNQLSLAIGQGGQNARLAAKLTGWKIEIKSETDYYNEESQLESELEDSQNEELEEENLETQEVDEQAQDLGEEDSQEQEQELEESDDSQDNEEEQATAEIS